jgi:hypothetical protein
MEHSLPPVAPPESPFQPELPAKKKSTWRFFEAFRKKDAEPVPQEGMLQPKGDAQSAEALPDRAPETAPAKRRRFGESVMQLLRGRAATAERPTEAIRPEQPAPVPEKPVAAPAETAPAPTVIERAHELGKGVLGLLKQVRREVIAVDKLERVEQPTDIQPLDEADERVRSAIKELVAPIEAYAVEHGITEETEAEPQTASDQTTESQPEPAFAAPGGDGEQAFTFRIPRLEAAFSVATAAAEYLTDGGERHRERHSRLGLFAVGAATVGVLVYNWRRQRELRREQRSIQKEHKRVEKQMAEQQQADRQRIEQLEQVHIAGLSQAQRQEHVHQVSQFAVAKAEAIRTVAHSQERIITRPVERAAQRPVVVTRERAQTSVEAPRPSESVAERTIRTLAEAPRQIIIDKQVRPEQQPATIIERALEVLQRKSASPASSTTTGGLGGLASTLIGLTTGKAPDVVAADATSTHAQQTPQPRRRTNQEWLLGVGLALGIAGVVVILMNS